MKKNKDDNADPIPAAIGHETAPAEGTKNGEESCRHDMLG